MVISEQHVTSMYTKKEHMKRRDFIKRTGLSAMGLPFVIKDVSYQTIMKPLFTIDESAEDRILIIIRMNGGNDGLNTVIPLDGYDNLVKQRSNLILPKNDILDLNTSNIGLHSTMTGMRNMFNDGNLSIIQNVGYESQNRSHFKSTDIWSRGLIGNNGTSGWLGRFLDQEFPNFPNDYPNEEHTDPFAISVGSQVSSTCQGLLSNFSMAVSDPTDVNQLSTSLSVFENSTYGDRLKFISLIINQSNSYSVQIENAIQSGNTLSTLYDNENKLAKQMRGIAQLISGGLQTKVYVLNVNGFDTHSAQVDSNNSNIGKHQELLKTISDAVEAFQDDLNLLGIEDRVLGMTFSEFGRQIASNASLGSDHGEAAPMFLFGSCLKNRVIGKNPEISNAIVPQKAVDFEYDFRDIYASILKDWFLVPVSQIQSLFEHQVIFQPLISCGGDNPVVDDKTEGIIVYPNPTVSTATLAFSSLKENVELALFDLTGQRLRTLFNKELPDEKHFVPIDVSALAEGVYILHVKKASGDLSIRLLKLKK